MTDVRGSRSAPEEVAAADPESNRVRLVGRLTGTPVRRALPSGDELVTFRVTVRRDDGAGVDTLECTAFRAGVRRTVLRWALGDVVAVDGSLRRRFWRSPAGPASRYAVEVERARRLLRSG